MNTEVKSYASFTTVSVQARVYNTDIAEGKYGEFAAITLIANLADDDDGITITFNNSNGIKSLVEKGLLPVGRQVTVTGAMAGIRETYTNSDGEVQLLKRPTLALDGRTVQLHLGALPRTDAPKRAAAGTVVKMPSGKTARRPAQVDDADKVLSEAGAF